MASLSQGIALASQPELCISFAAFGSTATVLHLRPGCILLADEVTLPLSCQPV